LKFIGFGNNIPDRIYRPNDFIRNIDA